MPEPDLTLLIDAAQNAAAIANRYWQTDQRITEKPGGAGPVSEGDLAVDTYLRETLTQARPGYGWLSEETEDDAARLTLPHTFIVDPIDGTRSYIAGERTWAISLALAHLGQITAAVVYLPQRAKLYSATRGGGAHLNGQAVAASTCTQPDNASVLAAKSNLDPAHWQGATPGLIRHFRPSLAYRLCLVAEGRFDAMLTLRDAWEWDIAAGSLIAQEARAMATDRTGAPLRFNSPRAQTPGVLTAPAALHGALSRRLS